MDDIEKTANKQLLYDPLFETPPATVIRDNPNKGFFGKAVVKKTVFVLVLLLFVGVLCLFASSPAAGSAAPAAVNFSCVYEVKY